jgi:uncharacterized protein (TIGR02118 family)
MYRLLALYPPPADPAHFKAHYASVHLPLASRLPGLRAMHHSFAIEGPAGTAAPYFCVWSGSFDDAAALQHAMASPEGQALAADVPLYVSGGLVMMSYRDGE